MVRQSSMSYLSDITKPLIEALRHFATLPAHQLAGHAANIAFWWSEVEHRRQVIRSYGERFRRMRDAEQAYGAEHGFGSTEVETWDESVVVPVDSAPRLRPSTRDSERQQLLRELDAAFDSFYRRAEREQLIPSGFAERGAPPNGGPATQLGNSGVTEGPPSVS
jgi:hypothetical protein